VLLCDVTTTAGSRDSAAAAVEVVTSVGDVTRPSVAVPDDAAAERMTAAACVVLKEPDWGRETVAR